MTPPVSLCILSQLVAVSCYTYQTEPLFMSFSDLAALEAKSRAQTTEASGPIGGTPAAGGHKVKTLEVKCDEDGVEVVLKVNLFDPGRPVGPSRLGLGLGLVSASQSLCAAAVSGDGEYVIRAPLTGCGGKVMVGILECPLSKVQIQVLHTGCCFMLPPCGLELLMSPVFAPPVAAHRELCAVQQHAAVLSSSVPPGLISSEGSCHSCAV